MKTRGLLWFCVLAAAELLSAASPTFPERLPRGVSRDGDLLTVDSSVGGAGCAVHAEVDLTPFAGRALSASIRCRGEQVVKARESWLGMKFMLSYTDAAGERHWPQSAAKTGSFDWTLLRFRADLAGTSAKDGKGTLTLGFQEGGGRLVFDLKSLKIEPSREIWPRTNAEYRVGYPARVRDLPPLKGVMLPSGPCKEDDFRTLHDWGATLVRYQMCRFWGEDNANGDLADYDRWLDGKLDHLDAVVLPLAEKYGLKVVIDLHVPPGGRNGSEMNMFHDRRFADHFIACWRRIATRFCNRRAVYGYDLINEPEQQLEALDGCDYWNLQRRAAEAVRAIDPDTTIIVESNGWDGADAFRYLSPLAMDNVIYQVHMYEPHQFTHQGVHNADRWNRVGYPNAERGWDREFIRRRLQPVLDFRQRHGARIYVGEFSAIAWGEGADRYIADCISLFDEYGFDWTYHAFREWTGWSVEHETARPGAKPVLSSDNPRMRALKAGFR